MAKLLESGELLARVGGPVPCLPYWVRTPARFQDLARWFHQYCVQRKEIKLLFAGVRLSPHLFLLSPWVPPVVSTKLFSDWFPPCLVGFHPPFPIFGLGSTRPFSQRIRAFAVVLQPWAKEDGEARRHLRNLDCYWVGSLD